MLPLAVKDFKEFSWHYLLSFFFPSATSAGRKKDDQKPLIGSEWRPLDGKEFDDRDGDSGFWTPDTETDDNQNTDTVSSRLMAHRLSNYQYQIVSSRFSNSTQDSNYVRFFKGTLTPL